MLLRRCFPMLQNQRRLPSYRRSFTTVTKLPQAPPPGRASPNVAPPIPDTIGGYSTDVESIVKSKSMNPEGLTPFIPTFFVPAKQLGDMGGYTMAHIQKYFARTRSLQIVTLKGEQFIRLHGLDGTFDMGACVHTNRRYKRYEPRPEHLLPFLKWFKKPGEWISVTELLEREPKEVQEKLPYNGDLAMLFFSQMQHHLRFMVDPHGKGLLQRVQGLPQLRPETTPCPMALSEVCRAVRENPMDANRIESVIAPEILAQMKLYFPSWQVFADSHPEFLAFNRESGVLMRRSEHDRLSVAEMPLAEQLRLLRKDPVTNKKKIRKLERRLATQANPDNPLLDHAALVKTVYDFLPEQGHRGLDEFVKTLPREVSTLLPSQHTKLFKNNGNYFQLFELQRPNNWRVMRAGLPLPEGVVRREFTEQDVVSMCVARLQKKSSTVNDTISFGILLKFLPSGARDMIKRDYGGPAYLFAKYPENFSLSQPRPDLGINEGSTVVTMIKAPDFISRSTAYKEAMAFPLESPVKPAGMR